MIKRAHEMVKEYKEQMRGGKGFVEITHIVNQDELKGKARLCAKLTINPGCSIGLHQHTDEEEIFYIIKGMGNLDDDGIKKQVGIGDSVLTGGGAYHSIENTGNEPLEILAVILLY